MKDLLRFEERPTTWVGIWTNWWEFIVVAAVVLAAVGALWLVFR